MFIPKKPYLLTFSCRADEERVTPYLDALAEVYTSSAMTFPMENPDAGTMLDLIDNASAAILFVSTHTENEALLRAALSHLLYTDTRLLVVYLDEVELPSGMQFQLSLCPEFFPNRHPSTASAVKTLTEAPYIKAAMTE